MLDARVYYFSQNNSCEIQDANTNISNAILPNVSLVIKPGNYSLWGGGIFVSSKRDCIE